MNKAQRMNTGQASVKRYMPHLLEHVRAGRVRPPALFTQWRPLDRAPEGYHTFSRVRATTETIPTPRVTSHQEVYRNPDHKPRHWLLKMFADRVDSWGTHLRRYGPLVLPLVVLGFVGKAALR
jgi:hypothetical protein